MKNTVRFLIPAVLAAVMCFAVFCTIKDDNGSLIDPGNPSDGPGGGGSVTGETEIAVELVSGIVVADETIRRGDTVTLRIQLADSSGSSGFNNKKITISKNDENDYLSKDIVTTDRKGQATVRFSSPTAGIAELTFKYGDDVQTRLSILVTGAVIDSVLEVDLVPGVVVATDSMRLGDTVTLRVLLKAETDEGLKGIANTYVKIIKSDKSDYVSRDSVITDKNGMASLKFSSGRAGLAEVTFKYGDLQTNMLVWVIDTTKNAIIVIERAPNSETATDSIRAGDTITLRIQLKTDDGSAGIGNGRVSVATSSARTGDWVSDTVVTTDKNGLAAVQFSSGIVGLATLTFEHGNQRNKVLVWVTDTTVNTEIVVERAPGFEVAIDSMLIGDTITLRVQLRAGSDSSLTGVGNGKVPVAKSNANDYTSSDTLTTDKNGLATVKFSSARKGLAELTFIYGEQRKKIQIWVADSAKGAEMVVERAPGLDIAADSMRLGDTITLRVQLRTDSANGLAGIMGGKVAIDYDENDYVSENPVTTDQSGLAIVRFSSQKLGLTELTFIYGVLQKKIRIWVTDPTRIMTINASLLPDAIDGSSKSVITVLVRNSLHNPVEGDTVKFFTDAGIITATGVTNSDGKAFAELTSDKGNEFATVTAVLKNDASCYKEITVIFIEDSGYPLRRMRINYSTVAQDVYTVNVLVRNNFNNPIFDEPVRFISTAGTIIAMSETDEWGKASVTLTRSWDNDSTHAIVTAYLLSDTACSAMVRIDFSDDNVVIPKDIVPIMDISSSPSVLPADGSSKSVITVTAKNANGGNPIVGDTITFTTNAGIVTAIGITDKYGKTTAELISERRNKTATVRASLKGVTAPIDVEFSGVNITAAANPTSIRSDGSETSTLTATLLDAANNPIVGEKVTFTSKTGASAIEPASAVTNTRGEARTQIRGNGSDIDTIIVTGAGATGAAYINFSVYYLKITPATGQSFLADNAQTTTFSIKYTRNAAATDYINNSVIEVSVTMGKKKDEIYFAEKITGTNGQIDFTINNPAFTDSATIHARAYTISGGAEQGITTADYKQYFRADVVNKITITGSPAVIGTGGGKATLTATVYDANGNRVSGEIISFNLLAGPGGLEYIEPATAVTGSDGTASISLVAGSLPSEWQGVLVTASYFDKPLSDTAKFTFAGPPKYITIRRNMGKVNDYPATYGKDFSAIVSDVNGNPVADGTPVTFSAQITGYVYYKWTLVDTTIDNIRYINYPAPRGYLIESEHPLNCVNPYRPYPKFNDINRNGRPDRYPNVVEPCKVALADDTCSVNNHHNYGGTEAWDNIEEFEFCNGCLKWNTTNKDWDYVANSYTNRFIETEDSKRYGVTNDATLESYLNALYNNNPSYDNPNAVWHYDFNRNGVPDPNTAIKIERTVTTENGIADNELRYGQSDAWRIQVKVWAEAQGLVTSAPEQFILPLAEGSEKDFRPFEY